MSECVQRKLNKRLIKLAGERIWSVHRVVQEMSDVSSLVNTNSFVSAVFEPQKEYKDSGIWNLMKYVWKDIQEGTSFISLQILWQFITIDSCVRAIINVSCQQCVLDDYLIVQFNSNKSTLGIYHPNYLLNSVTWLVAVNFGIFLWFGRYVSCSPEYKSRLIFLSPFSRPKKFDLYTSIYGIKHLDSSVVLIARRTLNLLVWVRFPIDEYQTFFSFFSFLFFLFSSWVK